jgi:hypothetical protein
LYLRCKLQDQIQVECVPYIGLIQIGLWQLHYQINKVM